MTDWDSYNVKYRQIDIGVVMDFPQAWAFVRDTKPEAHDPKCSWRTYNGGFLCDCHVLNDEYNRREAQAYLDSIPIRWHKALDIAQDFVQKWTGEPRK